ncbi:hypothetical protein QQF64_000296 [Cirrhinus molitorella]|uniref:Immunoglobulin V-set domain-containing protein n=1 Tax=Cirrhinus molitorella TaxID=172907 RepID=A0ABR3NWS2_9TELE
MFDDSSEGLLKVFISDLTAADEATYKCGVNIADDHLFTEIKLTVNQADNFLGSSKSSAVVGESVKLICNYPEKHNETKHICKENNEKKICQNISSSEQQRFEFSDSAAGVFTVIISNTPSHQTEERVEIYEMINNGSFLGRPQQRQPPATAATRGPLQCGPSSAQPNRGGFSSAQHNPEAFPHSTRNRSTSPQRSPPRHLSEATGRALQNSIQTPLLQLKY